MSTSLHGCICPSTVKQCGYPLKLTETVYFDLCLFLQCIAVCTSCTMRVVQWPYQMQMTRHSDKVWRRQRPAAACCHCCSARALPHTFPLLHCTRGRLSPGPVSCHALPHGPGRVSGPKAQNFFWHLFQPRLSVCLWSLALTMTWLHRKLQNLSSNQRTSVHGPRPVRWCTTQVQNSSNTFLASSRQAKYTAFCIQPNCGTPCRWTNVCSRSSRGHTSRSLDAPAGLGQAARLSTKPAADSHSATIRRQLYPLSNSCFIPTMFFDFIMTKQCLNREDVKHRISLQNGCMHCQNASCHLDRSFDNIGRQNNTKYPFKTAVTRNVSLCSSNTMVPFCITSPTMVS